jgi:3-oxoacyl-[acyl-carrier-protein] synthase-3
MFGAKIMGLRPVVARGFARHLPPRKVTNEDLSEMMETSDEWISRRTGIKTRYWGEPPMSASSLGIEAAKETFRQCDVTGVDAVVAATLSPDHDFPGIGVQIQYGLGLPTVPAYDLRNQCSGFLYGLEMATALVGSGVYDRILLVGSELQSTGMDKTTRGRDVAVLFGDGAGSCLVEAKDLVKDTDKPPCFEVIGSELHSDGEYMRDLWCEHPGSAHFPTRMTIDLVEEARCFPYMNGKKVFEHAVKRMTEVTNSLIDKCQIDKDEVSLFVPHQANIRINQMVAKSLGIAPEKAFSTIQDYGNTTAATIPIGMSRAIEEREILSGDIILSAAFGSGFTWGAAALKRV